MTFSQTKGHNNVKDSTQWVYIPTVAGGRRTSPYFTERQNQLLDFYLNYHKVIGDNSLDVLAGYSWSHFWRASEDSTSNASG